MKTTNLVKSLQSFGITAAPYKRPPAGKDTFLISILPKRPEGVIQIHQGLAEIEIHGSKKHRQAVVTVFEKPRVITRNVKSHTLDAMQPIGERVRGILRREFPVSIPGQVAWSYADVRVSRRTVTGLRGKREPVAGWTVTGRVTAKAGRSTTSHFLLGVDESHNFIAPLKEKPESVEHAYRILKPDLRAGSLRQGEWFFEPTLKAEAARLDKMVEADSRKIIRTTLGGSTHSALSTVVVTTKGRGKGKSRKPGTRTIYARGYVTDNRKGHHTALFLPGWHKVVRNKEIVFKRSANAPRRWASFD